MFQIFGRIVVPTTLDPVPANFRTLPGVIAVNLVELAAIARRDRKAMATLQGIAVAADLMDLRRKYGDDRKMSVNRKGSRR